MSTNYYALEKSYDWHRNVIHIGKSSGGWLFLFHACDEFKTFPQFKHFLESEVDTGKYQLYNEYGEKVSKEELIKLIESKQNDLHCRNNIDNFNYGCKNLDGYRFCDEDFD